MKEVLLLKCGEIVLKGLNRKTFEDRLLKNLKRRMAHVADCEITMRQSVVYVEIPDDADADAVMECASRVFGFATISRACLLYTSEAGKHPGSVGETEPRCFRSFHKIKGVKEK